MGNRYGEHANKRIPLDPSEGTQRIEPDKMAPCSATSPMDELLAEREKTHGDFAKVALIAMALKDIMRQGEKWEALDADMKQSLEMNALKVARIIVGNPNEPDRWKDIGGYARLIEQRLIDEQTE